MVFESVHIHIEWTVKALSHFQYRTFSPNFSELQQDDDPKYSNKDFYGSLS